MKLRDFLRDKFFLLLFHFGCMLGLAAFLCLTGYSVDCVFLILIVWLAVLSFWLLGQYRQRRGYFRRLEGILENVDQRFLLGELMPDSFRLEDRLYRELIRKSNQSVIEQLRRIEDGQKEYREYIESWVHEVKAPLTSIVLLCENHKDECTRMILQENQKVENFVNMALYYARSDEVYKDYLIKETDLQALAEETVARNRQYFIQNQMQVEVDCRHRVFTDEKWIGFILNQILLNSMKYKRDEGARVWIFTEKYEHGVRLTVRDNGMGISVQELPRIFEKGFTGTNGRRQERSTGMGLYLCRKLCLKLGVQIWADSRLFEGMRIVLEFPVSSYLSKL